MSKESRVLYDLPIGKRFWHTFENGTRILYEVVDHEEAMGLSGLPELLAVVQAVQIKEKEEVQDGANEEGGADAGRG